MTGKAHVASISRREFIRRALSLGVAGAIGTGLLSACGANSAGNNNPTAERQTGSQKAAPKSAGTTQIEFWHGFQAHEIAALQKMLNDRFTPKHPDVKVKAVGGVTEEKILTAISGGNPPDVALPPSSEDIGTWANNGVLLPLDDHIKSSNVSLEAYVPAGLDQCKFKGKYYALPFVNFNQALYWNKDLFKEAGLDPDMPPKSIAEMLSFSHKLTRNSGGRITQIGILPAMGLVEMAWRFGGNWYDAKAKKITADTSANRQALQFELDLTNRVGGVEEAKRFQASQPTGGGATDNPFYRNKIGMVRDGCWQVAFIEKYAPKLNYGVAPIPGPSNVPGSGTINELETNPIILPKGDKHVPQSWELVRFLSTDEATSREFATVIANIPQLKAAFKGFTHDPRLKVFVDLSNDAGAQHFPELPIEAQYIQAITTLESSVLTGQTKLSSGFAQLQASMEKAMNDAGA